jgi:hypothetical protein
MRNVVEDLFEANQKITKYEAKIKKLQNYIEIYGTHTPSCSFWRTFDEEECDCTWPDVAKELNIEIK